VCRLVERKLFVWSLLESKGKPVMFERELFA
jgi:hypothetical protein